MTTVKPKKEALEARSRVLLKKQVVRAKKTAFVRKRKPNKLRLAKKYWYELEAYFDPKEIEAIPVLDGGFMMGILEDFVVVEVSKDKSMEEINMLGAYLEKSGLKALIVREGIKFLRLTEVDKEKVVELDAILARRREVDAKQKELDKKIASKYGPAGEAEDNDSSTEASDTDS